MTPMSEENKIIEVAVALPVFGTYAYSVPDNLAVMIAAGKRIIVPFGRRRITGYVLGTAHETCDLNLKKVLDILDDGPLFPESMVAFFRWISDYYMYPLGQVIKNALPGGLTTAEQNVFAITQQGCRFLEQGIMTTMEATVLNTLKTESLSLKALEKKIQQPLPTAITLAMLDRGWVCREKKLRGGQTQPKTEKFVFLTDKEPDKGKLSETRKKIIDYLKNEHDVSLKELKKIVPTAPQIVKAMASSGQVRTDRKQVYRDPFGEPVKRDTPPSLTREQKQIVSKIQGAMGKTFAPFLLVGVTGSGKTEIYLQLALETLNKGRSVIILVPEIALISQMERRFRSRFGNQIAILHSGLSPGERYDQWLKLARGEITIAIGARSAIFAPVKNIGLIVVDEEHDASYKQETNLRYNARDVAVVRAKQHNAVALLGSATPSIQSYHNAITGKYTQVSLTRRIMNRRLPDITIVDLCGMRDQRGYRRFFSKELLLGLENALKRNEQAILFLNRRGFASLPICGACGKPLQCKNCDISMTYHQQSNAYRCHYCGFSMAGNTKCPSCGIADIRHLGFGTEKIETIVRDLFPDKNIARMDRDTVAHKGSVLKILKGLNNGSIDILIGTQMVAKGHDYPNITLVGIICADLSLGFPDFRAGEQTFQLLAQVSGRAGRGDRSGSVILQTYNPKHFSILCAKQQDVHQFYDQEITFRKNLNYPPFSRMIQIILSGRDKTEVHQHAQTLGAACKTLFRNHKKFRETIVMMGPLEAPYAKIASRYRWQILFKGSQTGLLHRYVRELMALNPSLMSSRHVKTIVDVDPVFMM
jgi:primosomal protein N' (replication factor Y) (superfamily II helicase)